MFHAFFLICFLLSFMFNSQLNLYISLTLNPTLTHTLVASPWKHTIFNMLSKQVERHVLPLLLLHLVSILLLHNSWSCFVFVGFRFLIDFSFALFFLLPIIIESSHITWFCNGPLHKPLKPLLLASWRKYWNCFCLSLTQWDRWPFF